MHWQWFAWLKYRSKRSSRHWRSWPQNTFQLCSHFSHHSGHWSLPSHKLLWKPESHWERRKWSLAIGLSVQLKGNTQEIVKPLLIKSTVWRWRIFSKNAGSDEGKSFIATICLSASLSKWGENWISRLNLSLTVERQIFCFGRIIFNTRNRSIFSPKGLYHQRT